MSENAENGYKWLKNVRTPEIAVNGWNRLEMAGKAGNYWKWQDWLEMAGKSWQWLEMQLIARWL